MLNITFQLGESTFVVEKDIFSKLLGVFQSNGTLNQATSYKIKSNVQRQVFLMFLHAIKSNVFPRVTPEIWNQLLELSEEFKCNELRLYLIQNKQRVTNFSVKKKNIRKAYTLIDSDKYFNLFNHLKELNENKEAASIENSKDDSIEKSQDDRIENSKNKVTFENKNEVEIDKNSKKKVTFNNKKNSSIDNSKRKVNFENKKAVGIENIQLLDENESSSSSYSYSYSSSESDSDDESVFSDEDEDVEYDYDPVDFDRSDDEEDERSVRLNSIQKMAKDLQEALFGKSNETQNSVTNETNDDDYSFKTKEDVSFISLNHDHFNYDDSNNFQIKNVGIRRNPRHTFRHLPSIIFQDD